MQQQDPMQELRQLIEEQKKATAYLQKLAGQILTYEQQQRKQQQAQWQRLEQHVQTLGNSARSVSGSTQQLIRETVDGIKAHVRDAISEAVGAQLARIKDVIDDFVKKTQWAMQALSGQSQLLGKTQTTLVWLGSAGLLIGSILAVAGTWGYFQYKRHELGEVRQAQMAAGMIGAFNAADVLPCDGQLCVNIDLKRKQTINGKTYYPAMPRQQNGQ